VLVTLGRTQDAFADCKRALAILEPSNAPASLSAGFYLADVCCGLGDLSRSLARRPGATVSEQRQRWLEARNWYRESMDAVRRLPNPGVVSPEGLTYHPAAAQAILSCDTALGRLEQFEQ
jgi:hypothetical protein